MKSKLNKNDIQKDKYTLVTVCPEQEGGLPTPRIPAERMGKNVVRRDGVDVTAEYRNQPRWGLSWCQRYRIQEYPGAVPP